MTLPTCLLPPRTVGFGDPPPTYQQVDMVVQGERRVLLQLVGACKRQRTGPARACRPAQCSIPKTCQRCPGPRTLFCQLTRLRATARAFLCSARV
jgi:hypothetical protein